MNGSLAVARREFRSSFNSPVAYVLIVAFLVFTAAWLFVIQGFFALGRADLSPYFSVMPVVFAFLIPAITMRSWAEERRLGTYELLLTLPFSEGELVVGKFLAAFGVLAVAFVLSLGVPLSVSALGSFDGGALFCQYLGILLAAAALVALGEWVSSLAKNQVSAFVGASLLILAFVLMDKIGAFLHAGGILAGIFNWLSLAVHYSSLSRGVFDTGDVAFYLILTAFFLYLTAWNVRRRKWS
jgi:ABC-2 type transport system permease protein